ncbi:MAG: carbohydrate-binding protein [Verrucomicrobiota bacterium]
MKGFILFVIVVVGWPASLMADTAPFGEAPYGIPGKIEAEHWDKGAAGEAYEDVDEENRGADYREATAVDIEARDDASNGHGIGWTRAGEWLVYTVEVKEDGEYGIRMPVASKGEGGVFHIEIDGEDVTGPMRIPDTGSWQQLEILEHEGVTLKKGVYQMKVVMDENGASKGIGDIDFFEFFKE